MSSTGTKVSFGGDVFLNKGRLILFDFNFLPEEKHVFEVHYVKNRYHPFAFDFKFKRPTYAFFTVPLK